MNTALCVVYNYIAYKEHTNATSTDPVNAMHMNVYKCFFLIMRDAWVPTHTHTHETIHYVTNERMRMSQMKEWIHHTYTHKYT